MATDPHDPDADASAPKAEANEVTGRAGRRLAQETGFWRRVQELSALAPEDVGALREDFRRIDADLARLSEEGSAASAQRYEAVRRSIEAIRKDWGTLSLLFQTLLELLSRKGIVNEDEFVEMLDEVDARDGVMDGTIHEPPHPGDATPKE
jgi:hypothetical protein